MPAAVDIAPATRPALPAIRISPEAAEDAATPTIRRAGETRPLFALQTLSDIGFTSVLAADGTAALAHLAEDADGFDVVFSDVMMPGMSGIESGQEIRRRLHDLPVVLTSGYSHVLAQNGTYGFELLHKLYSGSSCRRSCARRPPGIGANA